MLGRHRGRAATPAALRIKKGGGRCASAHIVYGMVNIWKKALVFPQKSYMWMTIRTDSQGRLYLSSDLREQYGEKFHVVEYEDRLELIPIDEDPLQAVRDEIGDALEGESIEGLREEALDRAKQEAEDDIEQAKRDAGDAAE